MNFTIEDSQVKETMFDINHIVWKGFSKKLKIIAVSLLFIGAAGFVYLHYFLKNFEIDFMVLVFCWTLAFLIFLRIIRTKRSFWGKFNDTTKIAFPSNKRKITITLEGIEGITDNYRSFANWNILTSYKIYENYISIYNVTAQNSFFIPIKLMTDEDYRTLLFYLRANKKEMK